MDNSCKAAFISNPVCLKGPRESVYLCYLTDYYRQKEQNISWRRRVDGDQKASLLNLLPINKWLWWLAVYTNTVDHSNIPTVPL